MGYTAVQTQSQRVNFGRSHVTVYQYIFASSSKPLRADSVFEDHKQPVCLKPQIRIMLITAFSIHGITTTWFHQQCPCHYWNNFIAFY